MCLPIYHEENVVIPVLFPLDVVLKGWCCEGSTQLKVNFCCDDVVVKSERDLIP